MLFGISRAFLFLLLLACFNCECIAAVRIKEIARIDSVRDNPLVGYGIVVGLSGSGDTNRSRATVQSVANALKKFGVRLEQKEVYSRNAAAVMITSSLPPFAGSGDKLDLNVSSLGDARSLVGGTLVLTPLKGPDGETYALAQGQVSVGGFQYDLNGNMVQKNHTTVGRIPGGATVEVDQDQRLMSNGKITLVLVQPDFTTADRVVQALKKSLGIANIRALHAGKIEISVSSNQDAVSLIQRIENTTVQPDRQSVVVINERTGTVVSGGDVKLDKVTISHGNLKVVVTTDYLVSQPSFIGRAPPGVESLVVPDTKIDLEEPIADRVDLPQDATIGELVTALRQIKTTTRDIIVILQAIKEAGALNAKIIIQ